MSRCTHITQSGHCADQGQSGRPPCTARMCQRKNDARPAHLANLARCADREQRRQYLAEVERTEGAVAAQMIRAEFIERRGELVRTDADPARLAVPAVRDLGSRDAARHEKTETAQNACNPKDPK